MRTLRSDWRTGVAALVAAAALLGAVPADAKRSSEAWLGVTVKEADAETVRAFGLKEPSGALVTGVSKGSPARKTGIKRGDLVIELDGKPVRDAQDLADLVAERKPGATVKVRVVRGGDRLTLEATLGSKEDTSPEVFDFDTEEWIEQHPRMERFTMRIPEMWKGVARGRLGIRVYDLSDELADYFKTKDGALVLEVEEDSPAERAAVKPGDVIVDVEGEKVTDRRSLLRALEEHEDERTLKLKVVRKGKTQEISVETGPRRRRGSGPVDEA